MKRLITLLAILALMIPIFADTVSIGTGTSTSAYLPIYGNYGYSYSQQIFTQSQIGTAGNITKIRFYYVSGSIATSKDWVIYMGHTNKSTFATTTDWVPLASLTQVYAGDVTSLVPAANNWMEITLNTPFSYNNTENLVIAVDENTPSYASMSWGAFTSGSNTGIYYYSDGTNPDPANPPAASSRINNINRIQLVFPSTTAPNAPVLVAPANNATNVNNPVLSWNNAATGGDATAYDVYFGSSENPPLVAQDLSTRSYTVSGWNFSTTYYWKVVAKNAIGASPASDTWSFTTRQDPTVYTLPYTEGFENGNTHNTAIQGWDQVAVSGSDVWTANTSFVDYNRTPRNGSWNAFLRYGNTRWLFKAVHLQADTAYRVSLYARQDGATASNASIGISYGTSGTAAGMTNTILAPTGIVNGDYQRLEGMFTPSSSGIYYIGILGTINSSPWYISIDDITIEEAPSVLEPISLTVANISGTYADLGWTENNNPAASQWDIIYGAPGFNPASEGTMKSGVTSNPYRLTDLTPSTAYHWYVRSVTTGKAVSEWAGPGAFTTSQIPAILPFSEDFEGWPNNWTVVNGTQTNQWHVGGATFHAGEKSAYISNDGGTTNNYNTSSASVVHLYRDIAFTADSKKFDLEFWWKGNGESTTYDWDYLKVYLVDPSVIPVAGTELTSGQLGTSYKMQPNWTKSNFELPGSLSGTKKRLVFSWKNDSSGGTQPPAAIDDILLIATPIPTTPIFSIEPEFKNFGNQQIGTSSYAQPFTIQNDGVGEFIIGQTILLIGENHDQFELIDLNSYPYTINSENPTLQFSVVFKPTSVGQKNAQLKIVDNLTREERFVSLTGNGIDSAIRELPYIQTWEDLDQTEGWVVYNLNGDSYTWGINVGANNVAFIRWNDDMAMDDWLISPPIILNAGTTYTISYKYWCQSATWPERMKVAFGNVQNPAAMTNIIADHPNITNTTNLENSVTFTPETTGPWYLGFHGYSVAGQYNLYLDDIRILLPNTQIAQVTATGATASVALPEITVGGQQISPEVGFEGLSGNPVITVSASCGPTSNPITNERLVLNISGGNLAGVKVTFTHGLGFIPSVLAFQIGAGDITLVTNPGDWTDTTAYFTVPSAKGSSDLKVIFPKDGSDTLPVTLSSFTAVLTADMHVKIAWVVESETDHAGYNLLRSEVDKLATAVRINRELINQGEVSGTQIAYQYTDNEVYPASTYYYWLESQSLNGETEYYGPLQVQILAQDEEQELPVIPMQTKLYSAFPNPFNPTTNLRYSMKEAGEAMIQIYNVKGQLLRTYHNRHDAPGYYQVSWDGRDAHGKPLSTGVYFYRMTSGKYSATKKMVLSK